VRQWAYTENPSENIEDASRISLNPLDPRAVLGAVKAQPGNAGASRKPSATAGLDRLLRATRSML
jgi:hypothetical protein